MHEDITNNKIKEITLKSSFFFKVKFLLKEFSYKNYTLYNVKK